ncbi:MAG: ribosome-associated translation inhibitor RaiA [Eubacteriales bacterium]|nr:ribosome-associated translation inhibitor RaiA [Eubacteriales bacterium]
MRFIISGKNIQVTESMKEVVREKIGRLDKYFKEDVEVQATLSVEKDRQKIEVTIPMKGHIIRAEEESDDMYVSIDIVVDIIERQIRKYKTKLLKRKKGEAAEGYTQSFLQDEEPGEEEIKIVRTKRFGFKPMKPEEACVQMELLRHGFFVFVNGDTEEVNVVYKRKDGSYGIIEPEF